jgi:hypothetical protein
MTNVFFEKIFKGDFNIFKKNNSINSENLN